jgi:hypothetical protein
MVGYILMQTTILANFSKVLKISKHSRLQYQVIGKHIVFDIARQSWQMMDM